jgi:GT2 family glycosyltransferase
VVISYRRHTDLVQCLEDLAAQRTGTPFEVVLCLQAYPAGVSAMLAERFGDRLDLHLHLFESGLGVHGARNAVIPRTRGDVIAFLDDDVRLGPDWVEHLVASYADASVGGVGGFVYHPGCTRLAVRLLRPLLGLASRRYRIDWGGFHSMPYSRHPEADQPADWLSGCNMSFRREALLGAGWFDEAFGTYGYDDVDMCVRVRAANWQLRSSIRLRVDHFPSAINRPPLHQLMREEEARRVLFVRKVLGDRPWWRARYVLRLALHLMATTVHGVGRGRPFLALAVLAGAREGLLRYGGIGSARGQGAVWRRCLTGGRPADGQASAFVRRTEAAPSDGSGSLT